MVEKSDEPEVDTGLRFKEEPVKKRLRCRKMGHEFDVDLDPETGKYSYEITFHFDTREIATTGPICPICLTNSIRDMAGAEEIK